MTTHPLFPRHRIFAPGPTPIPPEVAAVLSAASIHHRTVEFEQILERTRQGLAYLFQTKAPVYILTSSGTGAMEAAIANFARSGDHVLVVNAGKFGERWGKIAKRHSLKVKEIEIPWGEAADPNAVIEQLKADSKIKLVLFQACETSTGVDHPTEQIARAVHDHSEALVCVDAITALGVTRLPMDAWGLDIVVSGSQKALMLPPGISLVATSERARARQVPSSTSFYFDLAAEHKALCKGQTAWTPATSLVCGLDLVLHRLMQVGLDAVTAHHHMLACATRLGVMAMGLELFAKSSPAAALTSVCAPDSVPDGKQIARDLQSRFQITIANGQDAYAGKMFRIAHLGFFDQLDMLTLLSALEMTLHDLGHKLTLGAGVTAASHYFCQKRAGTGDSVSI